MLSTPTIPGKTINELLKYWASTPKKNIAAFISISADGKKQCLNRREVYQLASAFAYKLSVHHGVVKGDVVCIALPNSLERIICDMGVLLAGASSMNGQINQADGQDFIQSLKLSKARFLVTDPSIKNGAWQFFKDNIKDTSQVLVQHSSLPGMHQVILCQRNYCNPSADFLSQLKLSDASLDVAVSPSDLAIIMTTSGSTGYSKLVPLTHSNLCHFFLQVKAIEPLREGDHFINCAPLGWAGGYPQWYLGCGVTRYFIDLYDGPPTDMPTFIWNIMISEKIVYGFMSPVYSTAILKNRTLWDNVDWKPKTLCLAGQPVNHGHLEIIGRLCSAVDINYGMTECNLVSTHRIEDSTLFENGCVGLPGYGVSVKVTDKNKQEVPNGTIGEIMLRSPSLTLGYHNNDPANKAAFTLDGWFCTDDAGYIDPHTGKLHVEGRQSDSIMRGAYVLYPGWLEKIIRKVDRVKDVIIVPVPDKVLYNEICACIVTDIPLNGAIAGSVKYIDGSEDSITLVAASHISNAFPLTAEEKNNENNDETDRAAVFSSYSNRGIESISSVLSNGSLKATSELEDIRKSGMKKTLNITFNQTSVKTDFIKHEGESQLQDEIKLTNNSDSHKLHTLLKLEQEIRTHSANSQLLHVKDSMRMEPHYYVFFNKFAATSTGKTSRKEVRKLALNALKLGNRDVQY